MKDLTLHFAHANGFPAGAYTKLLKSLQMDYEVIAVPMLGHHSQYPLDDNWAGLVEELIDYIEQHAHQPVIGVGHSLGSILTFLAANRRPELFSRIIMLDPPLVYGRHAFIFFLIKRLGLMKRTGIIAQTRRRRKNILEKSPCSRILIRIV